MYVNINVIVHSFQPARWSLSCSCAGQSCSRYFSAGVKYPKIDNIRTTSKYLLESKKRTLSASLSGNSISSSNETEGDDPPETSITVELRMSSFEILQKISTMRTRQRSNTLHCKKKKKTGITISYTYKVIFRHAERDVKEMRKKYKVNQRVRDKYITIKNIKYKNFEQ
jgi:hypothetical protein